MGLARTIVSAALMLAGLGAWGGAAAPPADPALQFGVRDNVLDVSISPDGKSLIVLQPNGSRGAIASVVALDGKPEMKGIISSTGAPERLTFCRWATSSRVVCGLYIIDMVAGKYRAATRLLALDADGGNMKELSARTTDTSLGIALGGGQVIDWLGDRNDGTVLFQRWFVPQATTGALTASQREGLGVERLDVRTLARRVVEQPNPVAADFITDGHGAVRVMELASRDGLGRSRSRSQYLYRKKNSRDWLPLGTVTYSNYHASGFVPVAVDPDLDVAYGFDNANGRTAMYKVALDGSLKKELVFARPDSDVDQMLQIGRQKRVVGASWITDKRQAQMFDPQLSAFAASLGRALPGTPNIAIVDASADEQRLVVYASGDTDPGRFYLYDKATKHLAEILPVRPSLAQTHLASMKPITYPAADGTMVPAYLTLPPGSDGRNLPAIVLPHGGPTYRDEWNFDWLPQYFAQRGFAVIQPNYRGSEGYGQAWFKENGIRSWRTAIGDIDDAGRWLVKSGIADPAHLAIVGWSYGGYAALQSQVVDPALFKAVVAIAPVTDFGIVRQAEERDGGQTPAALDAVFGNARVAAEGSPARHAERFAAPVLLFHGDLDQNVAISQSRLMQDRLRDARKSVELIEYKGLDHQLDDSLSRADLLRRSDAFLRKAMGL